MITATIGWGQVVRSEDAIFSNTKVLVNNLSVADSVSDEFHHGTGGFSIKPNSGVFDRRQIAYDLDTYRLWGQSFAWSGDDLRLTVSFCTVLNVSTSVKPGERALVLARWKAAYTRQARNAAVEETRFRFNGSDGIEIRTSGSQNAVTRAFFIGSRLFLLSLESETPFIRSTLIQFLDSFRLLTQEERTSAMIAEFAPPPLSQDRSPKPESTDARELGIKGSVARIRESFRSSTAAARDVKVQEIHFNEDGFKTREISFNEGFPDVITSWGWIDGNRVNLQSAVNYPDREGPQSSRTIVVSGYQTFPDVWVNEQDLLAMTRRFGNVIGTDLDLRKRPMTRRRYANNGSIVYVEHFVYKDKLREIRTVDGNGGFLSRTRELLDEQNNIVEAQTLADAGQIVNSTKFEYEFDANRNWVKRKAFNKPSNNKNNKGAKQKAMGTYVRSIIYHESAEM